MRRHIAMAVATASLLGALFISPSEGAVSFTINAEVLKTASGDPMSTNALVILVASTTNSTFTGPSITSSPPRTTSRFFAGT